MKKNSHIFIAGENTMEGKAILKLLVEMNYSNIINLQLPAPDLKDYEIININPFTIIN